MSEKWTDTELVEIARVQDCTLDELRTRWIIQHGKSFYVMGPSGEYEKPIIKSELAQSLRRDLIRVPPADRSPAGIEWYRKRDDAQIKKSVDEILGDHCTVARCAIADMALARSSYNAANQEMREAVCPLADLAPTYHEPIAEWLRVFAGAQTDKLLDWLATVTRIDRPSCALLVTGSPDAGKEMLAQGIARRWRRAKAPTELSRVLEGFNEDLARCPFVFCDESLPTTRGGRKSTLADLRSMTATSSRTLARKFLSNTDLRGAIRLMLAANNPGMLSGHDDLSGDDQRATSERYLHIVVTEAAGRYLKSIGGRNTTEAWVDGLQLAEHIAWLEENRSVDLGPRFIVDGDADELQQKMLVNSKFTGLVLEWVVRHLSNGASPNKSMIFGNGRVLLNTSTLCNGWGQYIKSDYVPNTTRLGTAISNVSFENLERVQWADGDGPSDVRYHAIKPELLYAWSKQNLVGDPDALRARIEKFVDVDALRGQKSVAGNGSNGSNGSYAPSPPPPAPPLSTASSSARSLFDS